MPTLALGVVGLTSHYCLTQAFRSGDATVVVPLDFLRIPLIALVGWMFYGEALDGFVFAGAGLIICGVLWNLLGRIAAVALAGGGQHGEGPVAPNPDRSGRRGVQTLDTIRASSRSVAGNGEPRRRMGRR